MKESPSYFAIIPADVRYDKKITPNAKLLYAEITALCNAKGNCWATNKYFSELYSVSQTSISKWISSLISNGYIKSEIKYLKGSKQIDKRYLTIIKHPIEEKLNTPIEEKLKDNNTSINKYISSDFPEEENGILSDKPIESNQLIITQVEPEGFDSLHFVIAKMFHSLFLKLRGENDTLKKVKTESYVETIRLLLNVDKRSITQLAALKLYLEDSKKEGSKLNPFWADTIFSVKAFREKSKNGVHRWDLICLELKKWQSIEGNYQRAMKLAETINQKAKEYDRIQEGL